MSDLPDFDNLWDYNDPEKTEKAFRELLAVAENSAGPEYHAQLLTQIARTHSLRRDFESAHRILDDAELLIGGIDTTLGQNTLSRTYPLSPRARPHLQLRQWTSKLHARSSRKPGNWREVSVKTTTPWTRPTCWGSAKMEIGR